MPAQVVNEFTFISYVAHLAIHKSDGGVLGIRRGESFSAASDEEAWMKARAKAVELTRDRNNRDGYRYEVIELTRIETHHKVTCLGE